MKAKRESEEARVKSGTKAGERMNASRIAAATAKEDRGLDSGGGVRLPKLQRPELNGRRD